MSMSLAELLAEEGFKARRPKTTARASFRADAVTTQRGQRASSSLSGVKKAERIKSDLSRYQGPSETPASDHKGDKGKKPRENFTRRNRRLSSEITDRIERNEVAGEGTSEIVEVGVEKNVKYNDLYYNGVFDDDLIEDKDMKERNRKYGQPDMEYVGVNKNSDGMSANGLLSRTRSYNHRNKQKKLEISSSRLSRSSISSKTIGDVKSHRQEKIEQAVALPSLDDAAVRAIVSIFSGYAKHFLDDEDFRASLHHNSFSSLDLAGLDEGLNTESKVIVNLEQAIETVENAAEECASAKDLKRASLQLSVITGLNSNDLKDGFTSGIPNLKLSACAHLYLGMIYKIQKKDKISAKHFLQVFCDSPFQARTKLLAGLWDDAFLPQLLNVKVWYENESTSLKDSPRKVKLLDKFYNEILDSGTYQYARYYKDWLSEMIEAPSLPSVEVPPRSVWLFQKESHRQSPDTGDPIGHFPLQPMVSRKLYEAIIAHSHNTPVELVDYEEENLEIIAGSSRGSNVDESHMSPYKLEQVVQIGRAIDPDCKSHQGRQSSKSNYFSKESPYGDEVILERLAKTFFETHHTKISGDASAASTRERFEEDLDPESPYNFSSPCEGVPEEYTCPITRFLFEDPVTLETGQTLERAAVRRWLHKGNRTCPVTGNLLQCKIVPGTNFILKHVIDDWKSKTRLHISDVAYQLSAFPMGKSSESDERVVLILEHLIVASSKKEREVNVKQIRSLGGLQFLLRIFNCGSLEERKKVSELLCRCIEVDSGCRNQVAGSIDKSCLLELLFSDLPKARFNAVMMLAELVSQNRRKDAKYFLAGFQDEEIGKSMNILLTYLQDCRSDMRPLVAVLILQLNLLVERLNHDGCKEEAISAITLALERSLTDEKVRDGCCRALLVLGARFSFLGKVMTEDWILKKTGFLDGPRIDFPDFEEENVEAISMVYHQTEDSDEEEREKWLSNLSTSLLVEGNKPFWEALCKCLTSDNVMLVRVCLTTIAWLTAAISKATLQLYDFSPLISNLKNCVKYGQLAELKILASMSLFNFHNIPACRELVTRTALEIGIPHLKNLAEVTWTAKELCAIVSDSSRD